MSVSQAPPARDASRAAKRTPHPPRAPASGALHGGLLRQGAPSSSRDNSLPEQKPEASPQASTATPGQNHPKLSGGPVPPAVMAPITSAAQQKPPPPLDRAQTLQRVNHANSTVNASQNSDERLVNQQIQAEADRANKKRDRNDPDYAQSTSAKRRRQTTTDSITGDNAGKQMPRRRSRFSGFPPRPWSSSSENVRKRRARPIRQIQNLTNASPLAMVPERLRPKDACEDWGQQLLDALQQLATVTKTNTALANDALQAAVSDRSVDDDVDIKLTASDVKRAIANIGSHHNEPHEQPRSLTLGAASSPCITAELPGSATHSRQRASKTTPSNVDHDHAAAQNSRLPTPPSASTTTHSRRTGKQPIKLEFAEVDTRASSAVPPGTIDVDNDMENIDRTIERKHQRMAEIEKLQMRLVMDEAKVERWASIRRRGNSARDPIEGAAIGDD